LEKQRSYDGLFAEKTELLSKVEGLEDERVRVEREINILKHEVRIFSISLWSTLHHGCYWTSRENSSELIELSSINKVSLV
jgi:hypothetical protein